MKWYKAEYADDNFEIIYADNDSQAIEEADDYEEEHGIIFNLIEIDKNYEEVRKIL